MPDLFSIASEEAQGRRYGRPLARPLPAFNYPRVIGVMVNPDGRLRFDKAGIGRIEALKHGPDESRLGININSWMQPAP